MSSHQPLQIASRQNTTKMLTAHHFCLFYPFFTRLSHLMLMANLGLHCYNRWWSPLVAWRLHAFVHSASIKEQVCFQASKSEILYLHILFYHNKSTMDLPNKMQVIVTASKQQLGGSISFLGLVKCRNKHKKNGFSGMMLHTFDPFLSCPPSFVLH